MDTKTLFLPASLLMLAFLNFSCMSTGELYKGLTKKKGTLNYIHDSDIEADKGTFKVGVAKPIVSDPKFILPGSVRKVKAAVVPLIIFNSWNFEFEYRIGKASIQEDIESFVRSALITESNRSGSFTADTIQSTERLTLEIEIDSIGAKGPYYAKGHFVFLGLMYFGQQMENTGPAVAYSRFFYRLRVGDKVLMEDYTSSSRPTQPLRQTHTSTKELRNFYNTNLVEALSQTLKTNIEIIVEDVNIFLDMEADKLVEN